MQTQAYFENIQEQIIRELNSAHQSVKVAVAWFTDDVLYETLCNKAKEKIAVELIISNDDINKAIDFTSLKDLGGKVYKVGDGSNYGSLMHNKFCIIDNSTVIIGSYNWTKKAQYNHESITIIKDDAVYADEFVRQFSKIISDFTGCPDAAVLDFGKISIRLEVIKKSISLEDKEDIDYQTSKLKNILKQAGNTSEKQIIEDILKQIDKQHYADALEQIEEFIKKFTQLTAFVDTELFAIRFEIKGLEYQISSLEDEKSDIEKQIFDFEVRYNKELGELIVELLKLKKERLKNEAKDNETKEEEYQQAEKDYEDFSNNYKCRIKEKVFEITEEDSSEMKSIFRKASKLCHPDVVEEEFRAEAHKVFIDLKDAYDRNDIKKVKEIFNNIKNGIFNRYSDKVSEKEYLRKILEKLRYKRSSIENEINELKSNGTFKTISGIENWNEYFENLKKQLNKELIEQNKNGK